MTAQGSWRACVDFGTAASKVSLCAPPHFGARALERIRPLAVGTAAQETTPYMAQSSLLFDNGRIYFGAHALERASDAEANLLQSFKMFFGAHDLDEALRSRLRRDVDASGQFSQRDALVLYVAYLMRLAENAMAADPGLPQEALLAPRRYAHPQWRAGAMANVVMTAIFDEAAALPAAVTAAALSPEGLEAPAARAALDEARQRPRDGRIETGVFEAQAAAECHFAFAEHAPDHVLVLDMGAGTTDITGFAIAAGRTGRVMREIEPIRVTAPLACDTLDRILVAMMVDKVKTERRKGARKQFWRRLSLRARRLKETLFREGACEAVCDGQRIVLRLSEFLGKRPFNEFRAAMLSLYAEALAKLAARAVEAGRDEIGVVLAGGGASLPLIQQMAQRARPKTARIRRVLVQPIVPDWARGGAFHPSIAPVFPQLSISIGGAVAALQPLEARF
ncbi:MAG: Hsp70 family protein [Hyphomonadaceae bacterium]